jgi:hypothetical protein
MRHKEPMRKSALSAQLSEVATIHEIPPTLPLREHGLGEQKNSAGRKASHEIREAV